VKEAWQRSEARIQEQQALFEEYRKSLERESEKSKRRLLEEVSERGEHLANQFAAKEQETADYYQKLSAAERAQAQAEIKKMQETLEEERRKLVQENQEKEAKLTARAAQLEQKIQEQLENKEANLSAEHQTILKPENMRSKRDSCVRMKPSSKPA